MNEWKNEYLKSIENDDKKKNLKMVFNKILPYEEKYSKDFCQMIEEEIFDTLSQWGNVPRTLQKKFYFLRDYTKFAKKKGYAKIDWLDRPAAIIIQKVRAYKQVFISNDEYEKYCSKIMLNENGILYETFFRCIYEGILGLNMISLHLLRISNICLNDVQICDGRTVRISDRLSILLKKCSELEMIGRMTDGRAIKNFIDYPYQDSVFKCLSEVKYPEKRFNRYWKVIIQEILCENFEINDLRDSGVFFRVSKMAKEQGLSFEENLMSNDSQLQDGRLKEIVYGSILVECSFIGSWTDFQLKFKSWVYENKT